MGKTREIILRGKTFDVGDGIVMGGVRGEVVALSFMQTKTIDMGEPPSVQSASPAIWIHSRNISDGSWRCRTPPA
jgi:hypothetical protein